MPAPHDGAVYRTVLNRMAERERVRLDSALPGTRASATGFSFPRDMASALAEDLQSAGVDRGRISTGARLQFQGGYSPVPRRWDMVIFEEERPVVVADIKSMIGGAFGNNLINRLNDVLALATNLNRIFDDEARRPFRPCVSFLFVVERTRETRHRSHFIVSNDVHTAVGQCLNYLRTLDELGAGLQTQHRNERGVDIDFRRARGTVVIGHPERVSSPDGPSREQIDQTLRSYNAHLSRLRVLTYADLLDSAERSLRFASEGAISRGPGR